MTRISIILCLLLLAMLSSCGLVGCSATIEVTSAHGFGRLEAEIAGESLVIQLETQTLDSAESLADIICPSYDVSLGGARVSGLAPGSPPECDALGLEVRAATWTRLAGPVILTIFQLLGEVL